MTTKKKAVAVAVERATVGVVTKPRVVSKEDHKLMRAHAMAEARAEKKGTETFDGLFSNGWRFVQALEPYREKKDGSGMTGDPRSVTTPETWQALLLAVGDAYMGAGTMFAQVECQGVKMSGAAWCEYKGSLTDAQKKTRTKMRNKRSRYVADFREGMGRRAGMTEEEMKVQGGGRGTKKGAQQPTGEVDSAESSKSSLEKAIANLNDALRNLRQDDVPGDVSAPADAIREALADLVNLNK